MQITKITIAVVTVLFGIILLAVPTNFEGPLFFNINEQHSIRLIDALGLILVIPGWFYLNSIGVMHLRGAIKKHKITKDLYNLQSSRKRCTMIKKLLFMLCQPDNFFEDVRKESSQQPLIFFFKVTAFIAIFTPIMNYLGIPSTDYSAAYQAQIIAWRITTQYLLPRWGNWAYMIEVFLILGISLIVVLFMTSFIHLVFRLLGGKGPILNAWKSACYGAGPCVLLGWIPYWALFVAVWSLLFQFYYAPKVLYRMKEGTSLIVLALIIGATLLELIIKGTTVYF